MAKPPPIVPDDHSYPTHRLIRQRTSAASPLVCLGMFVLAVASWGQTPIANVWPTELFLPITNVGSSETIVFTVTNDGGGTLSVNDIAPSNPMFTVSPVSFDLTAAQQQIVTVTFTPTAVGAVQATLSVWHNASGLPDDVIANGTGRIAPPTGDLADTELVFVDGTELYTVTYDGAAIEQLSFDGVPKRNPAWSPDGSRLAYGSVVDGGGDIYVLNLVDGSVTQVTIDRGNDNPDWSPDGTNLVYVKNVPRTLHVIPATGGTATLLGATNALDPAWSPDGSKIAYKNQVNGDIMTISSNDADGSSAALVTDGGASGKRNPAWSPDGSQIAFDGTIGTASDIFVVPSSGGTAVQVTSDPGADSHPSWSPDGTQLALLSLREGWANIWVVDATARNVTQRPSGASVAAGDWSPFLSGSPPPAAAKIAFVSDRDGDYEIYTANADGTDVFQVTDNSAGEFWAAWSPDGTEIAFPSNRDGDNEIFVANSDGTNVRQLTDNMAWDDTPSWSPDGSKIAFLSDRDGNPDIFVMNADGTNQELISKRRLGVIFCSWATTRSRNHAIS